LTFTMHISIRYFSCPVIIWFLKSWSDIYVKCKYLIWYKRNY
jgi:hypothetical protein